MEKGENHGRAAQGGQFPGGERGQTTSVCPEREGEGKANAIIVRNASENAGQLLHEQRELRWPHKPSGAPRGDSIRFFKLL